MQESPNLILCLLLPEGSSNHDGSLVIHDIVANDRQEQQTSILSISITAQDRIKN
jgi:hypothetical protein